MTAYESKAWLAHSAPGHAATISQDYADALSPFRAAVERAPRRAALRYFDGTLSYAELDAQSDALACAWLERGCARRDRRRTAEDRDGEDFAARIARIA